MKKPLDPSKIRWMPIPGYSGYSVTQDGRISGPMGREMKPMSATKGHQFILAWRPGVPRKLFVHRAVLMAFVRMPRKGEFALHHNDDPADNRLENLKWGTRLDNARDKIRNGGQARGEDIRAAKLTRHQVREIRQRRPKETLRALAAEYGVSHTAIHRAAEGIKWKHIL